MICDSLHIVIGCIGSFGITFAASMAIVDYIEIPDTLSRRFMSWIWNKGYLGYAMFIGLLLTYLGMV